MQNGMRVNMGFSSSSLIRRQHCEITLATTEDTEDRRLAIIQNRIWPPRPPCPLWWRVSILQRDLRDVRRNRALRERQRRSERHHRLHPFAAARHVEPHEQMRFRVHTNADAVVLSQLVHRQRIDGRRDGSGVVEDRSVERASDTPPVLRVYQEQIAIAEAVVEIPAQTMRSAKRW